MGDAHIAPHVKSSPTMSRFAPSSCISKAANCKNRTKQKTGFSKRNPVFLLP